MGNECVSCWALRTRIEKCPGLAQEMLDAMRPGFSGGGVASNEARSCQETALIDSGGENEK
jgi:hypothetical protein